MAHVTPTTETPTQSTTANNVNPPILPLPKRKLVDKIPPTVANFTKLSRAALIAKPDCVTSHTNYTINATGLDNINQSISAIQLNASVFYPDPQIPPSTYYEDQTNPRPSHMLPVGELIKETATTLFILSPKPAVGQ